MFFIYFNFRTVLAVYGMVILLITFYSLCFARTNDCRYPILQSFSVHHNIKELFTVSRSSKALSHLDGLKSISIIWIVIIHSYMSHFDGITNNILDVYNV